MDAFETIVGGIFERRGYWVKYGFKVELTKAEKRRIGLPTAPRWEIDLLGYKSAANELLVIECKSYLDGPGVRYAAVAKQNHRWSDRYKLFNNQLLRQVVLNRLVKQLEAKGSCRKKPKTIMCLAAGNVLNKEDKKKLIDHFARRGWIFLEDSQVYEAFKDVWDSGYEDDVAVVVAKLLLRNADQGR